MEGYTQIGNRGWRAVVFGGLGFDIEKVSKEFFSKIKNEFPNSTYEYYYVKVPYFTKTNYAYISGKLRRFVPKTLKKTDIKNANYFEIKINSKVAMRFYKFGFRLTGLGYFYHKDFNEEEVSKIYEIIKDYDYQKNLKIGYKVLPIALIIAVILFYMIIFII